MPVMSDARYVMLTVPVNMATDTEHLEPVSPYHLKLKKYLIKHEILTNYHKNYTMTDYWPEFNA